MDRAATLTEKGRSNSLRGEGSLKITNDVRVQSHASHGHSFPPSDNFLHNVTWLATLIAYLSAIRISSSHEFISKYVAHSFHEENDST
jgi:hypothetical protein